MTPKRNGKHAILTGVFVVALLFSSAAVGQEVNTTSEAPALIDSAGIPINETVKIVLTGDPQKDYIHDPNLPRELNGYDLSDYPFYKRVPNIEFNLTCEDRKDGFYASIPHKCQVYHHCLFGIRYDFLCPNYTAFDQTNFNCNFVSEVDCKNSELYFDRNNALYKEVSTTTTTTTTAAPKVKIVYVERPPAPQRNKQKGVRRKTTTTAAPLDDYYYYYDYDDEPNRGATKDDAYYYYDELPRKPPTTTTTTTTTTTQRPKRPNRPLRRRTQALQSTRRRNDQFAANNDPSVDYDVANDQPRRRRPNAERPLRKRKRRKKTTTTTTTTPEPEYYDEYYDYYYDDEILPSSTTTTTEQPSLKRRPLRGQPTAADRRRGLIEAQRAQRQEVAERRALQSQTAKPAAAQDYVYDDTAFAEDTATIVEEPPLYADVDYKTENIQPRREKLTRRRGQNAGRRRVFKRPRNRRLRNKTPGE